MGWHPVVRKLDGELATAGGCVKAGNDDCYLLGPPAVVYPALERFEQRIQARCCLSLQRDKTEVFCWGELPPDTPPELKRAGAMVDGDDVLWDCSGKSKLCAASSF